MKVYQPISIDEAIQQEEERLADHMEYMRVLHPRIHEKTIEECAKNILSSLGHIRFLKSLKKMREEAEEWAREQR